MVVLLALLGVIPVLVVLLVLVSLAVAWNLPGNLIGGMLAGILVAFVFAVSAWQSRRTRRRVQAALAMEQRRPLEAWIRERLEPRSVYSEKTARVLATELARAGWANSVLRVHAGGAPPAPPPLRVDFEARPLDETLPGFMELLTGETQPPAEAPANRADGRWLAPAPRAPLHPRLLVLVVLGSLVLLSAEESYRRGVLSPGFLTWLSLTIVWGLLPSSAWRRLRRCEWLVVPGGILVRRARWRDAHWTLHLFDRAASVLVMTRPAKPNIWGVTVADGQQVERVALTDLEAQLLLRAWTSDIPPPPLERLVELEG